MQIKPSGQSININYLTGKIQATGKTRMALQLLQRAYQGNGFSIQFHPNTTYENFVGGLAPVQTADAMGFRFAPQQGFLSITRDCPLPGIPEH